MSPEARVLTQATRAMQQGSKSFAAASSLFGRDTRNSVRMLYAWCRHCDDMIDGQAGGHGAVGPAPVHALVQLEQQTRLAFGTGAISNPAFAALRLVARRHGLPLRYPLDHLAGFRMDVDGRSYDTFSDLLHYCYHVAGVVGIMMAAVMDVREAATLDRACDLGLAFQLTNIARDVVDDAKAGRVYLPLQWLNEAGLTPECILDPEHRPALADVVARLLAAAEPYYASAAAGISALPHRSAWAVATARAVYREIGTEVLGRGAMAWDQRVYTSRASKLRLMLYASIETMGRRRAPAPLRDGLWMRPE